jgi:hypothetical protein
MPSTSLGLDPIKTGSGLQIYAFGRDWALREVLTEYRLIKKHLVDLR